MNTLWSRFLQISPWVRILLAALAVVVISLGIAFVGVYNLYHVLEHGNMFGYAAAPIGPFQAAGRLGPLPEFEAFMNSAQKLQELYDLSFGRYHFKTASLTPELRAAMNEAVAGMAGAAWPAIMDQAYRSSHHGDQFSGSLARKRMRCLASFSVALKEENPDADLSPVLQAFTRDQFLVERISPTLVTKMASLALTGRMVQTIHDLVRKGVVKPAEAASMRDILEHSRRMRFSLNETLTFDLEWAENFCTRLYARAPLGCWLLERIFGHPLAEYRKIVTGIDAMDGAALRDAVKKVGHPLEAVMVPTLTRARESFLQRAAWEEILLQELQDLGNASAAKRIDPYTNAPLLMKRIDGRVAYYAAGPDGRDGEMTADDVFLP